LFTRQDVEFNADGSLIRGWLYRPEGVERRPIVVMAAGFSCVKEMHLPKYAEVFAAAGLCVLLFDFRNLGASEGSPRQELNPWQQAEDYRHAITHATTIEFCDPDRVGIWGSSYSGGHCLMVGATDRRVKCVAVQVPTISGRESGMRRVPMNKVSELTRMFAEDRARRMHGESPTMRPLVGDVAENPLYPSGEARDWFLECAPHAPNWRNEVTLRSMEYARAYEPGIYAAHVSPTPLLMVVGLQDHVTCTDLQLDAYNQALEPKKLVLLEGGHFAPYTAEFERSSSAARDWFVTHLIKII
jgi:cephalosporin-C deacetylase-like acetyl esterase